jgi:hypothetical protein
VIHLGSVVILLLSSNWQQQQMVFIHLLHQLTHIVVVNQEYPTGGAEPLVF